MSTLQQQNEHTAPIADSVRRSAGWCSRSAFLVAFRAAQLVSTITALGLLAFLVDYGSHGSFELAVSVISLTYLVVIASATLPLNLYALTAVSVFEAAVFALWAAASATLGSRYSQYSCTIHAPKDDGDFYYGVWDYLHALSKECKVGQASIAFAAFSAFLSLCALCLLCVNVLAPMNAVFVGEVRPEGTRAHLRRFTALAVACAPGTANNDVETPAPVTVEAVNPVTEHA